MKLYIYRLNSLNVNEYTVTEIFNKSIVLNGNSIVRLIDLGVLNCGFQSHVSFKKLTKNQVRKLRNN